jgi:putative nucleotidyltransferase with HDIG domain
MERTRAWALLTEYTQGQSLLNHALAVEAAMRAYARSLGEDEDRWGATGLLHDFDYERWPEPENHPKKGSVILRSAGCDEEVIYAILSHAQYLELERNSPMDRALFAVDELCGLITAVALVRPSRSVLDVKLSSIKKKWKQRTFAEGVNRQDILQGAGELGVELDQHIQFVLEALQSAADEIGLASDRQEDDAVAVADGTV